MFQDTAQIFGMAHSCFYDQPSIIPPVGQVKASTILDILDHIDVKILAIPPSVLEELSHDEKALEKLRGRHVIYGGGPLAEVAGNIIKKRMTVICIVRTTESGEFPCLQHDPNDWNYIHYPEHMKGIEFRKHDDELYEMVFVRDKETDKHFSAWITFPDLKEYSTKDLYAKHPDKPGMCTHRGRSDATIALSNGEKFVPIPYEGQLKQNKLIRDALLIGQGQFEVSVLIELNDEYMEMDRDEALKQVIPTMKSINVQMPRFVRMSQDRVLFTNKDKPMIRAGKGTVIRKATLKEYDQEIQELYAADGELDPDQAPLLKDTTEEQTMKSLISIFSCISELDENIGQNTNIYNLGFDSLNTMKGSRAIQAILTSEGVKAAKKVTPTMIYSNPTIHELAKALRSLNDQPQDQAAADKARWQEMDDMLTKYSESIKSIKIENVAIGPDASLPADGSIVYNLINPSAVPWSSLSNTVLASLPAGTKTVPMKESVRLLEKSSEETQVDTTHNPAVKLLDFFTNLAESGGEISAQMQVENAKKVSKTLREVEPVNGEWMKMWMEGWGGGQEGVEHEDEV